MIDNKALDQAAQVLSSAQALVIAAGAGLSVDSGLPDFRGGEGFWEAYPPYRELGLDFYDLADPKWFRLDPHQAWGFYGHRLELYRRTAPHAGFDVLHRWGRSAPQGCFVVTSNVDGQFQSHGFDEDKLLEVHGSIHHLQCSENCSGNIWAADEEVAVDSSDMRAQDPLPHCPECSAVARPNVLMFGDWAWNPSRTSQQHDRFEAWLGGLTDRPVVLEAGAGTAVPTIRSMSEHLAAILIRINPRDPAGPSGTISIPAGAEESLLAIDDLRRREPGES